MDGTILVLAPLAHHIHCIVRFMFLTPTCQFFIFVSEAWSGITTVMLALGPNIPRIFRLMCFTPTVLILRFISEDWLDSAIFILTLLAHHISPHRLAYVLCTNGSVLHFRTQSLGYGVFPRARTGCSLRLLPRPAYVLCTTVSLLHLHTRKSDGQCNPRARTACLPHFRRRPVYVPYTIKPCQLPHRMMVAWELWLFQSSLLDRPRNIRADRQDGRYSCTPYRSAQGDLCPIGVDNEQSAHSQFSTFPAFLCCSFHVFGPFVSQ